MGKVLNTFENGWLGAISRSVDDIVEAYAVTATDGVGFGIPVVLNTQKTGVVPFASTNVADDFIGITVRSASKTPDTYGSNEAKYNRKEMADVLTRGSVIVNCLAGTPEPNGNVYIHPGTGKFVAVADIQGADNILIPNAKWRGGKDTYHRAEVLINVRYGARAEEAEQEAV